MSNKQISNDDKIMALKSQIVDKKGKLKNKKTFKPVTNCSLEFRKERINLNVLSKEQLSMLLLELNLIKMSAINLKMLDEIIISGYSIDEWMIDIKEKLEVINLTEEARKLQLLEAKLTQLLSNEKKVALEIDEIMGMLGNGE